MATTHQAKFEYNRHLKLYRVMCTCGYADVDADLTRLQATASTHDMAWEPVKPTEPSPFRTAPQ